MDSPNRPAVYFATPTPTGFYSQKLWRFIFLVLEPRAVWSGLGLGSLASKVSLPIFYPPHVNVGLPVPPPSPPPLYATPCLCTSPPVSTSLLLLPIWMNVASLNPWLLVFHTAWFSDGSGCYLFWGLVVILSVVVRGRGEACLPIPPSWPEVLYFFWSTDILKTHRADIMRPFFLSIGDIPW